MPLPKLIEIIPFAASVRTEITVPGSKSITNRALILAALAEGEVTLTGALWSEDTQVMVEALKTLGFAVQVVPDPEESCNRIITVRGLGGTIPHAGTPEQPLEIFVGNAGTAARFLAALVCLGNGVYRLSGVPRMHERPQAALFQALRQLGHRVESAKDKLPAVIHGSAERGAPSASATPCQVSVAESSQFASALLLCAERGGWTVQVTGANAEEMPYVEMTRKLCAAFPGHGGEFHIEPDASSASYFWAAGWLAPAAFSMEVAPDPALDEALDGFLAANLGQPFVSLRDAVVRRKLWQAAFDKSQDARFVGALRWLDYLESHSDVAVCGAPVSGWQIDGAFRRFWPLPAEISRQRDLGDSIMTAIVLAAFGARPTRFVALAPLRVQECERVAALRTELTKCGVEVLERGDELTVFPSSAKVHGAEIETYDDHRMAMCFAILGLKVPGVRIHNPACVKKTFPNFFQKLAAPAPDGLGVEIRDARSGRRLALEELFAE